MKLHATCNPIENTRKGFTYIEVLVALAIMGSILGMGTILQSDAVTRNEVKNERDTFISALLMTARARALANVHGHAHGVYIDNTDRAYVLFEGTTYDAFLDTHQRIPFQSDYTVITHDHGSDTILFEALTGNVLEGTGTYTLAQNNYTLVVDINDVGRVDW